MVERILIVEGSSDDTNGDLRRGFSTLLRKKLAGRMPRIVMGEDKKSSVRKFSNLELGTNGLKTKSLLIDLDNPESERTNDLNEHNLTQQGKFVCFMIQEMEAWFLSQPKILDSHFGEFISRKIPKKHPKEQENPSDFLIEITRQSKKGPYHKVRDASDLLILLDPDDVSEKFDDFRNLIELFSS